MSDFGEGGAHRKEPSLWASRWFVVAAVVVGALVVLGIALSVVNVASAPSRTAAPGTPAPAGSDATGSSASSTPAAPSVCGLPGNAGSGTVSSAPVATWSLVGTTAAPRVEEVGPGRVDRSGYRSCFAHTPTGAVVAAANIVAMGSQRQLGRRITADSVAPGPGRDAALRRAGSGGVGQTGVRLQIAGFRLLSYAGATAEVDIAMRTSTGALGGQVLPLVWSDGDWKVRLADTGDLPAPVAQLPDLRGYIPWAGA